MKEKKIYAVVDPELAQFARDKNIELEVVDCIAKLHWTVKEISEDPENKGKSEVTVIDTICDTVVTIKVKITEDAYICEIYNLSL